MCVIAATAAVGIATSVAGAGTSLAGGFAQAKEARERGEFEAGMAYYRAALAGESGKLEAVKMGIGQLRRMGSMRAAGAAGNIDMSFGSAFRIFEETMRFDAFDHLVHAQNVKNEVASHLLAGQTAMYNAEVNAASAMRQGVGGFLGGLGSAGMSAVTAYDAGIFGGSGSGSGQGTSSQTAAARRQLRYAPGSPEAYMERGLF